MNITILDGLSILQIVLYYCRIIEERSLVELKI